KGASLKRGAPCSRAKIGIHSTLHNFTRRHPFFVLAGPRNQAPSRPLGRPTSPESRHYSAGSPMSILVRLVILVLLAVAPAIAAHAINEILLNRDREQEIRLTASIDAQVR